MCSLHAAPLNDCSMWVSVRRGNRLEKGWEEGVGGGGNSKVLDASFICTAFKHYYSYCLNLKVDLHHIAVIILIHLSRLFVIIWRFLTGSEVKRLTRCWDVGQRSHRKVREVVRRSADLNVIQASVWLILYLLFVSWIVINLDACCAVNGSERMLQDQLTKAFNMSS